MESIEHIIQKPVKRTHKTPVFFQHGAWHGAWCWQLWMDYFSSLGYEVHAISLPGHGQSSLSRRHINFYSDRDYVDTLAGQLETIHPAPVVVGHSLGGAILQKYLESHQLPGAVLLATLPSIGMFPMFFRMLRRHPLPTIRMVLTMNFYEWVRTPELAQDLFLNPRTEIDVKAFQKQLVRETVNALPLLFPFARVNPDKSPLLVISAENDIIFTVDEGNATAARYGAKNMVIHGQAHNLMMESGWKQTADVIDDWITHELELP
jgi:pimeloyl-ACP methyl ester carboxylesterase